MAVLGIKTAGKKCFSLIDSGKGWLLRQTVHFCFSLTGIILWEIPGHSKTLQEISVVLIPHTACVWNQWALEICFCKLCILEGCQET